jgi:hypothetical protein
MFSTHAAAMPTGLTCRLQASFKSNQALLLAHNYSAYSASSLSLGLDDNSDMGSQKSFAYDRLSFTAGSRRSKEHVEGVGLALRTPLIVTCVSRCLEYQLPSTAAARLFSTRMHVHSA